MVSPSRSDSSSTPPPPSPDEDDIVQHDWSTTHMLDSPPRNKGKGKARELPQEDDEEEEEDPGDEAAYSSDSNTYPPVSDRQAETKRIEENLRRWEIAERQRRKAMREGHAAAAAAAAAASANVTKTPSLVSTVTRGASLLWRGGNKRGATSYGAGNKHSALQSTDNLDDVPLDDIDARSLPARSYSPSSTPTSSQRNSESTAETVTIRDSRHSNSIDDTPSIPENPFDDHPPPPTPSSPYTAAKDTVNDGGGLISPFADSHRVPPRVPPPLLSTQAADDVINDTSTSPILTETATPFPRTSPASQRRSRLAHPPAMPLNLPSPKAPPPPLPSASTPPSRVSSPDPKRSAAIDDGDAGDEKPVRWWHEWLCGCGEGPDRGGEYQSGRTNPLE